MSRSAASSRASWAGAARPRAIRDSYLSRSELPLTSLLFLLPLLILYELGTHYFASDPLNRTEQRIIAFNMMQEFFRFFHAGGRYLPALAVAGILLAWHIARNDPWKLHTGTSLGMYAESLALALPLVALSMACAHYLPLSTGRADWRSLLVLSVGAGIYEELVFRLIGMTVLSLILRDTLRMNRGWSALGMVVIPAVLFSVYHYLGQETFQPRTFVFRTGAGLYFGVLFLTRGFGITAGTHAAYDVVIVLLGTVGR